MLSAKLHQQPQSRGDDRRIAARLDLDRPGTVRTDHILEDIVIRDLTRDGCQIETSADLVIGRQIGIGIAGIGIRQARIVWRSPRACGCMFDTPLAPGEVTLAFEPTNIVAFNAPADGVIRRTGTGKWSPRATVGLIVGANILLWGAVATAVILS